ncbi:MAG: class I SAM-dependent methyltransferase, partial [bacterium]
MIFSYSRLKYLIKQLVAPDHELKALCGIVKRMNQCPERTALQLECDQVFIDRMRDIPQALKTDYWLNHFEWKEVMQYPQIGGHILDFGCGTGHLDIMLARQGCQVFGVDGSPIGIAIADRAMRHEPPEVQAKLTFRELDITHTNSTGLILDSVISLHVFEHVSEPGKIIRGLRQFVRTGSYLLVSVPYGNAYD